MAVQTAPDPTPKTRTLSDFLQDYFMLTAVVAPFFITLYAAISLTRGEVSWKYPLLALALASLTNLGTTAGYHRMLTHQSFKAHPIVQYVLLILGAMAGMSSPSKWVNDHIHHHSHSDDEHDIHSPHTPRFRGKKFETLRQWYDAHTGWVFRNDNLRLSGRAKQVAATPAVRFVDKTANWWLLASLLLPLCFGWNAFVWCSAARLFLNHHITWCVNSVCHLWGRQPFKNTRDRSKNNAIIGVLALGEGWHNNHHFRPASARHGLLPGQLDLTYTVICLLEKCHLVTDVQRYAHCKNCQDWYSAGASAHDCSLKRRASAG